MMRKSSSFCSFTVESANVATPVAPDSKAWSLLDGAKTGEMRPILPLKSFNHIAREVINIEKSKNFYCDLLGFVVVPRPPFECNGYWLWGYGLSLHIVETKDKADRRSVLRARYKHFTNALPRVDHFAFMTNDITRVKSILEEANVYFKHEIPPGTGFEQLFFFDPDGNVIEVSTCSARSEDWCHKNATVTSTESFTSTSTETASVSETMPVFSLMEPSSEFIDSVTVDGNFVQFQFGDGSTDVVHLQEIAVKDESDYRYEESDFLSERSRSKSSDISEV